jgi:transcriptional regulator with XRE-family HTH domain
MDIYDDSKSRAERRLEFSRDLRTALRWQRMTQAELSRASGLGEDSISGYVRGRTLPRYQQMDKIVVGLYS